MTLAVELTGFQHIRCLAHTLKLTSQRALKLPAVARLQEKIQRISVLFHRSTTAAGELKRNQTMVDLPQLKLITDGAVRWTIWDAVPFPGAQSCCWSQITALSPLGLNHRTGYQSFGQEISYWLSLYVRHSRDIEKWLFHASCLCLSTPPFLYPSPFSIPPLSLFLFIVVVVSFAVVVSLSSGQFTEFGCYIEELTRKRFPQKVENMRHMFKIERILHASMCCSIHFPYKEQSTLHHQTNTSAEL